MHVCLQERRWNVDTTFRTLTELSLERRIDFTPKNSLIAMQTGNAPAAMEVDADASQGTGAGSSQDAMDVDVPVIEPMSEDAVRCLRFWFLSCC